MSYTVIKFQRTKPIQERRRLSFTIPVNNPISVATIDAALGLSKDLSQDLSFYNIQQVSTKPPAFSVTAKESYGTLAKTHKNQIDLIWEEIRQLKGKHQQLEDEVSEIKHAMSLYQVPSVIQKDLDQRWMQKLPELKLMLQNIHVKSLSWGFVVWWYVWKKVHPEATLLPAALHGHLISRYASMKNVNLFFRGRVPTRLNDEMRLAWRTVGKRERGLMIRLVIMVSEAGNVRHQLAHAKVPRHIALALI